MEIQDVDEAIRRVIARADRIEGQTPEEYKIVIDKMNILRAVIHRPFYYDTDGVVMGTNLAAYSAVARVAWERNNPGLKARMLADEAIGFALRVARLELVG